MREHELQQLAEVRAADLGLLYHHCACPARCRGPRGFPDVLAIGPGGLLLAELKGPYGETSPDQDLWIWTAHQSGLVIPVINDKAILESQLRHIA